MFLDLSDVGSKEDDRSLPRPMHNKFIPTRGVTKQP